MTTATTSPTLRDKSAASPRLRDRLAATLSKKKALPQGPATKTPPQVTPEAPPPPQEEQQQVFYSVRALKAESELKEKKIGKPQAAARIVQKVPGAKVIGKDLLVTATTGGVQQSTKSDRGLLSNRSCSVADERTSPRVLVPCLKKRSKRVSKAVYFHGGAVNGSEVTAVYLYEAIKVPLPWPAKVTLAKVGPAGLPLPALPTVNSRLVW